MVGKLILLRGVGDPDAFPRQEKRLHRAMAAAYHLGDDPDLETLERIADRWRPSRSWVGLLLRNSHYPAVMRANPEARDPELALELSEKNHAG